MAIVQIPPKEVVIVSLRPSKVKLIFLPNLSLLFKQPTNLLKTLYGPFLASSDDNDIFIYEFV